MKKIIIILILILTACQHSITREKIKENNIIIKQTETGLEQAKIKINEIIPKINNFDCEGEKKGVIVEELKNIKLNINRIDKNLTILKNNNYYIEKTYKLEINNYYNIKKIYKLITIIEFFIIIMLFLIIFKK